MPTSKLLLRRTSAVLRRDVSPAAEARRVFYLLYEMQKYMPIAVWRRGDMGAARRSREQSLQLAAQLG